jgi:S-formylglutathione hydrolase FrmB
MGFRAVVIGVLFLFVGHVYAAKVDTVSTYSPVMKKNIKAVVITPDSYTAGTGTYPVVYMLHGYSNNYSDLVKRAPATIPSADTYQLILVCADGNYNSWYFDSPVDSSSRFETYVSKELVSWIDGHYRTVKSPQGRAITGLSMGGHGALYLAFKHPDVFSAVGSMSGAVDIRPFPLNWDIAKMLGAYTQFPDRWEQNTVINMTHLLTPGSLSIIIDCGTEDFFIRVNNSLHDKLLDRNIPHDYITRPGIHDWTYWNNSVVYQLLFMRQVFDKQLK